MDLSSYEDCLALFRNMRHEVNWEVKKERHEFVRRFGTVIENWMCEGLNLRDIFQKEEIHRFLSDIVIYSSEASDIGLGWYIAQFVVKTGLKDEPDVDVDGKPSPRRTTALHLAARVSTFFMAGIARDLFKVYNRFDVNYTDESGLTHFHVACMFNCGDVVEKFLELGQDPNQLVPETADSPLHLALKCCYNKVPELLLRNGANPHLANKDGFTPLHIILKNCYYDVSQSMYMLFKLCNELGQPVQIDPRDKFGNTPLHWAVRHSNTKLARELLRRGADANSTDIKGQTTLHIIVRNNFAGDSAKMLLEISEKNHLQVQVDARDELGRTPLQWAVARLSADNVDVLLDHGADLASFVFPDESYFADRLLAPKNFMTDDDWLDVRVRLVPNLLACVERLKKRGYELDRSDALTIMKTFVKYGLFERPTNFNYERWYDDEELVKTAKETIVKSSLTLYDLFRLRPREMAKRFTCEEYCKFTKTMWTLPDSHGRACFVLLCEQIWRKFFFGWALEPFMELTRYRLPILCCDMIIDELTNENLCNVCLAAAGQN